MAYSITQARPLLNAAELELFDQSRAGPIKSLTLARLRGKVTRTRALRDKYRDLFRRQTVAVRKAPATKGRSPTGADNERTQRKADILQEVLERFEARLAQIEAKEARDSEAPRSTARAAKAKPAAQRRASAGASTQKAAAGERKAPAAKSKPAAAAKKAARSASAKAAAGDSQNSPSPATAAAKPRRATPAAKRKATAAVKDQTAVQPAALALQPDSPALQPVLEEVLHQRATRSPKAPSVMAPTAAGKAQAPQPPAPLDLVPAALRSNPLRQAPGQIAIHAHQGASMRRAQGKRDSR